MRKLRYIIRRANGHHAVRPEFPFNRIEWDGSKEPWAFYTWSGANRARLNIDDKAQVIEQELVL